MSVETNRAVALQFYDHMSKLEFKQMFDLMADDATWTVAGKPETFWPAGTQTKLERQKVFDAFTRSFVSMTPQVKSSTADGARVALEVRMKAVTPKGLVYDNEFLILFRFRNGKIVGLLEHLDQQTTIAFMTAFQESEPAV